MTTQALTRQATEVQTAPQPALAKDSPRGRLVGTGVGNALEWFDWSVYSTFAPFFAAHFFAAGEDPVVAFLQTLAVFAVGFVARPAGGFLFGWIADRHGRRSSLSATVGLAALGSLVIAVSPGIEQIGWGAALLLVIARIAQGLAHGGEQPAAQSYLAESAPAERRGLWSSLIYFSGTIGANLGVALAVLLTTVLTPEQLGDWGWRIPFALGAVGGLFALVMRQRLHETDHFAYVAPTEGAGARRSPFAGLWTAMVTHRRSAAQVIGMTVGVTIVYYLFVVAASGYSIAVLGMDSRLATTTAMWCNVVFLVWLPLWGIASDRLGRKPVMLACIAALMVVTVPLSQMIDGSVRGLATAMLVSGVFIAGICSVSPAVMTELFPTRIRTLGVAVPLSVAVAVFGGTSYYLQVWMSSTWGPTAFAWYVVAALAVSLVAVLTLPETRGRQLTDEDADFTGARATSGAA